MKKWAIVNDWHIPKHDQRKVNLWFKIMKDWKPDTIDINGDFVDMESVSRWASGKPEEYVQESLRLEMVLAREYLDEFYAMADEVMYRDGNHEERLYAYIASKAPALSGIVTIPSLLALDEHDIEYRRYHEAPDERFGGFYLHHGELVDVGRELDKYMVPMVVGHSHRLRVERKSGLKHTLIGFEGGHMVDLEKVDYSPHFNWQHGFLYGYYDDKNAWLNWAEFQNNAVVFEGELYEG